MQIGASVGLASARAGVTLFMAAAKPLEWRRCSTGERFRFRSRVIGRARALARSLANPLTRRRRPKVCAWRQRAAVAPELASAAFGPAAERLEWRQ